MAHQTPTVSFAPWQNWGDGVEPSLTPLTPLILPSATGGVRCADSPWKQRAQIARFVLQDLVLFGLSVSGVASTVSEKARPRLKRFRSFFGGPPAGVS